jgi:hypothetical protein
MRGALSIWICHPGRRACGADCWVRSLWSLTFDGVDVRANSRSLHFAGDAPRHGSGRDDESEVRRRHTRGSHPQSRNARAYCAENLVGDGAGAGGEVVRADAVVALLTEEHDFVADRSI